jgi:hypothetical protein
MVAAGLEAGQLPVADRLEEEPDREQDRAGDRERAGRTALQHAELHRDGGQPQDHGLEQVDLPERVAVPVAGRLIQQIAVAGVLGLAVVAPPDVPGQPDAPQHGGG